MKGKGSVSQNRSASKLNAFEGPNQARHSQGRGERSVFGWLFPQPRPHAVSPPRTH